MVQSRRAASSKASAGAGSAEAGGPRILKKYPNRRLYDTKISSYITIEDVRQLIVEGEDFEVRDAKSGEDLTRQVLLQIIAEHEQDGEPMLST